jgi:hypothetical protein
MFAFLVVIISGTAVGLFMHGSLRNLFAARLSVPPLVIGAALLQIAAQFVPRTASTAAYVLVVLSYGLLFMFAAANWRLPGMAFIACGAALNYTVILANRGMPIAAWAAARVGFVGADAERLVLRGKHFVDAGGHAHLHLLGDTIPLWRQPSIASVGDLIIWAGLILLIASLVRGPRGRRTRMDARDEYAYVPPDHVSARAGDAVLREIDLRDPPADLEVEFVAAGEENGLEAGNQSVKGGK